MNPLDQIEKERLSEFCIRNHIQKLSLFGSYLNNAENAESDIDLLVEFEDSYTPGLIAISRMEIELSSMLEGKKIDLRTAEDLSRYFRDSVIEKASVQYARS